MPDDVKPEQPEQLLKPKEVAALFGLSPSWVRDHTTRCEPRIPHVSLGPRVKRYRPSEIAKFLDDLGIKPGKKKDAA